MTIRKLSILKKKKKNLHSSDQWTRFQLRIFQGRWSYGQFHRARRWQLYSFLWATLISSLSRQLTVLIDTWLPHPSKKINSFRIPADVAKRFLIAHRDTILFSYQMYIFVVLRGACQIAYVHQPLQSLANAAFCPTTIILLTVYYSSAEAKIRPKIII